MDHGEGKDLSLEECPRDQLEKEVRLPSTFITKHSLNSSIANHVGPPQSLPKNVPNLCIIYLSYLSAEQRTYPTLFPTQHTKLTPTPKGLNYLIKFDSLGKLRWARNNDLVDTTAERWKDSGNGGGIVPEDLPDDRRTPMQLRGSFESLAQDEDNSSEDDSSGNSSRESNAAMHYLGPPKGKSKWAKVFYRYFTLRGVTNRLLRKTVRRNTWIYITVR